MVKEKREKKGEGGRGGPMDEEGRIWCPPTPESFVAEGEREREREGGYLRLSSRTLTLLSYLMADR